MATLRLSVIVHLPMPHQLILQRTQEAFPRRIVVAITLPTHTHHYSTTSEDCLIETRPIRIALIAMMDESRNRASAVPCHPPGFHHHRQRLPWAHGPAHHAPRIEIEQHRDREPPGARGHERQIPGPYALFG